jgi:alpha-tubulin suppressor-like RCC1 family protein
LDAISISAGGNHTCAVFGSFDFDLGLIECWGQNNFGQLGDGTTTDSNKPVELDWGAAAGDFHAVVAGWAHTCAIGNFVDEDPGDVNCWGYNKNGELGDGTNLNQNFPSYSLGLSGVVSLAAGDDHTCALLDNGSVKCWGDNEFGQLGDGTTNNSNTPVDVKYLVAGVIAITAGWGHTCALIQDGGVRCWGDNEYGQLGDGTDAPYRSVRGMVGGLQNDIVAISAGGAHTCALERDGVVMCWGQDNYGQLGDGAATNRNLPVNVDMNIDDPAIELAAGRDYTCALTRLRKVQCWGGNTSGQLGDGTVITRRLPIVVDTRGNDILGITAGWAHTCAAMSKGGVLCWGSNKYGELGNGTNSDSSVPVEVIGLSS